MLIESIKITNFRQFYGSEEIRFSMNPQRNVTVIHGANGSGKTSLLNAFKWCFYGVTDFDTANDNILNEAAIQDQEDDGFIDVEIAVKFAHEGKRYEAMRTERYKRVKGLVAEPAEKSKFALDVTGDDGQTKRSPSPFVELNSILPENLQSYFFFNGERIEKLAGVNQSVQIQDAIRKLMGLELVDRGIAHLARLKRQYRKEVKEGVSDEQKELHDLIDAVEDDIERFNGNITGAKRSKEVAVANLLEIESELKKYEKSRDLQDKRDNLDKQIEKNMSEIERVNAQQKRFINESGFLVLSSDLFGKCSNIVEQNRKLGILPYGIKEQFIDDRIRMGKCICGTQIIEDSAEHLCLLDARKHAGSDDLESVYTGVSALLRSQEQAVSNFQRNYRESAALLSEIQMENIRLRGEADEISAQLTSLDDKEIVRLETEYRKYTEDRDRASQDEGVAKNLKIDAENKLKDYNQQLERINEAVSNQDTATKRMNKTELLQTTLIDLRGALAGQVREDLSGRVDRTFQSIIRKQVRAIIDDDFKLQVLRKAKDGTEHVVKEQSTGERQVTSLSFIASIIALAKEKHAKKTLFFQGGLYPLVMDSPFGALDEDYRKKVAANVSDLAEQVIMFVSNSQWKGQVKAACDGKVGKSYQLVYHSPKADNVDNEYTMQSDNGFEYSTVKEVQP